jgi:hypothetical protein
MLVNWEEPGLQEVNCRQAEAVRNNVYFLVENY